jgi:hypothetical protein
MLENLQEQGQSIEGARHRSQGSPPWPLFTDWVQVNSQPAELMAGQHRVEALKILRQASPDSAILPEWVCDLYDRDALPPGLQVQLRANRRDLILPDRHGQIWAETDALSRAEPDLFQGPNKVVEATVLRQLGLSGLVKFPIRRMVTLWKNDRWRPMISRWCQSALGRETFNITAWETMASSRLDEVS